MMGTALAAKEQILDDQECQSRGEEPVDGPQKHEEGVEVVAQEVESRSFDVDGRGVQASVLFCQLAEDAEVPGRDGEVAPLEGGVGDVGPGGDRRDDPVGEAAGVRSQAAESTEETTTPAGLRRPFVVSGSFVGRGRVRPLSLPASLCVG